MCIKQEIPWRNCQNCLSETCLYAGMNRECCLAILDDSEMDAVEYAIAFETLDNMPCFTWYAY